VRESPRHWPAPLERLQLPFGRLAARIADQTRTAADQCDRCVTEALESRQAHDRKQRPNVKAGRRRIEPDVRGHRIALEHVWQTFGGVVNKLAPLKFSEQTHR
jgi:hypothetical protein